jgi:hypothetical protein
MAVTAVVAVSALLVSYREVVLSADGLRSQAAPAVQGVAATRLALLRDGMRRGLYSDPKEAGRALAEERQLLEAIAGYRETFAGRDPQAPVARWDGTQYQVTFPDGVARTLEPPDQPVVPIPVVLAPPPPAHYGYYRPYR